MNTTAMQTTFSRPSTSPHFYAVDRTPWLRRFFGVVARPQSYRNIAYLLVGLPLGILWFTVLAVAVSVSVSMVVVALIGIPMLWTTWYLVRASANTERSVANVLLDTELSAAPLVSGVRGNVWVRLTEMSRDRDRWSELGYLLLRFPAGIATFTVAVTALCVPVVVAYAPISARYFDGSFGDWDGSADLHQFASTSPWSWLLIPASVMGLFVAFHALNALAGASGRWASGALVARPGHDSVRSLLQMCRPGEPFVAVSAPGWPGRTSDGANFAGRPVRRSETLAPRSAALTREEGTLSLDRQPTLEGKLVRLRPLEEDDFEALFAVSSDPLLWDQHPAKERTTREGFELWFEEAMRSGGALVAIDRSDDTIIGTSRFYDYRGDCGPRSIEIGWTFIARSHWGGQYNGELKQLMLRHAFESVDEVFFRVHEDNFRSQRAVEKLGAERVGTEISQHGHGTNIVFRLDPTVRAAGA